MGTLKSSLRTASLAFAVASALALALLGATALVDPGFVRGTMGGGFARLGMTLGGGSTGPYFLHREVGGPGVQKEIFVGSNPRPSAAPETKPAEGAPALTAKK